MKEQVVYTIKFPPRGSAPDMYVQFVFSDSRAMQPQRQNQISPLLRYSKVLWSSYETLYRITLPTCMTSLL